MAGEQVRIAQGTGCDLNAVDVSDRGAAEDVIRLPLHGGTIHIAKSYDGAQTVTVVAVQGIGVRHVYQAYRLIDAWTIDEFPGGIGGKPAHLGSRLLRSGEAYAIPFHVTKLPAAARVLSLRGPRQGPPPVSSL